MPGSSRPTPTSARFDGGFGSAYLARQVGQKFAREIFFLGETYAAEDAYRMGMVNRVVPHAELETVGLEWAAKICGKSPTAQRMLKFAFNAIDDGLVGQQVFAGEATRLAYMTDEAVEGRDAFLEKRPPDWSPVPVLLLSWAAAPMRSTDSSRRTKACRRSPQHGAPAELAAADGEAQTTP